MSVNEGNKKLAMKNKDIGWRESFTRAGQTL